MSLAIERRPYQILFLFLVLFMMPLESIAGPQETIQKQLQLKDPARAERVYGILNKGIKTMTVQVQKETDAVLKKVKSMGVATGRDSKEIALDVVAQMSKKDKDNPLLMAMQEALSMMQEFQPEESPYVLKKRIALAMKASWPNSILKPYFTYPVASRLYPLTSAPDVPEFDTSFAQYRTPQTYFNNKFWDLLEVPAAKLPEGALPILLYLVHAPLSSQERRDVYHNPGSFIARYQERACPYAVDYLSNPERYDTKKLSVRDLEYAQYCPEDVKKELLTAAFQSGWLAAENYLHPSVSTSAAVHSELTDTPYGKPRAFPDNQLPDASELEAVKRSFEAFWKEYETKTANVKGRYDRSQIRRELQNNYQLSTTSEQFAFQRMLNRAVQEEQVAEEIARAKATPTPTPVRYTGKKLTSSQAKKDPELRKLLQDRKKMQAIQRYRQLTQQGLRDAKKAIDDMLMYGY